MDDVTVVIDFDRTLTTPSSHQCHDILGGALGDAVALPPRLVARLAKFICFDVSVEHWWTEFHAVVVDECSSLFTRAFVDTLAAAALASGGVTVRPDAIAWLAELRESRVPVLIASAGVTEIISALLAASGVDLRGDLVRFAANECTWASDDADAPLVGISSMSTSASKKDTVARHLDWFRSAHRDARFRYAVIGDSLHDAEMVALLTRRWGAHECTELAHAERAAGAGIVGCTAADTAEIFSIGLYSPQHAYRPRSLYVDAFDLLIDDTELGGAATAYSVIRDVLTKWRSSE